MINRKRMESKYLKEIIEKRYFLLSVLIIIFFSIISFKLFSLQIGHNSEYLVALENLTDKTITGESAPRGRIYDRNYNLLVDNKAIKTIYYKKQSGWTTKKELEIAKKMADIIDVDFSKMSDNILKEYWLKNNETIAKTRITEEEYEKLASRKITSSYIEKLKLERITDDDLKQYTDLDKEAAYIYYLMNKGYSYQEKIIKNVDVLEKEYAYISENMDSLNGFGTKLDWERIYLYDDVFRSILGRVSSDKQGIPEELAEYYLGRGYKLNDRVGISYLELQYEEYLKGKKPVYKLAKDNSYELVESGSRGNDIVLTIDINVQKEVENILKNQVLNAKSDKNTEYYNRSFVIISDPKTGEILAMSGKQVLKNDDGSLYIVDYTPGIVTLPVTPGSIVKGASMSVGYKYGAIDIGTYIKDECIKIKSTPIKCSWKTLGMVNDVTALQYSSNVYQFKIAISVGGGNYEYDKPLSINPDAFNKYRDMYASYGLGVKTGIDLPTESLGYSGSSQLSGYLLDYSIGQYDNYTPIQISQYINTIANNGTRLKPYLLKKVYSPSSDVDSAFGDLIYEAKVEELGKVDLEEKYIKRIQQGFNAVMNGSLGYGYMGKYNNSAGKTGTSQSFIDTDSDGIVDQETITHTFGGYAPYNDPVMSIVVISPDISHRNTSSTFNSSVNKRISSEVVNKFFEIFK